MKVSLQVCRWTDVLVEGVHRSCGIICFYIETEIVSSYRVDFKVRTEAQFCFSESSLRSLTNLA